MVWAWVAKCHRAAFRPADARWDDVVPFHSSSFVGDQVLVEPDVGTRPAQSGFTALDGHQGALGR